MTERTSIPINTVAAIDRRLRSGETERAIATALGIPRHQVRKCRLTPFRRTRTIDILRRLIAAQTDHCILWPGKTWGSGGYPSVFIGKQQHYGHRLACIWTHGDPPTANHQAAHDCGTPSCVNPRHLRWATPAENNQDKIKHGTLRSGSECYQAKLTDQQVRDIRIRYTNGGHTYASLAADHDVSPSTIGLIVRGKTHRAVLVEKIAR